MRVLTGKDRTTHFALFDEMFRGRAAVFKERLGWTVQVRAGWEIDRYDEEENPVYLIATDARDRVVGSLRLLPTTGPTMLRNEFAGFFDEPLDIQSPLIRECTRFCVHPTPDHPPQAGMISRELLTGLCEFCLASGIRQLVGLYDRRMERVYARIGWTPTPIAIARPETGHLIAGVWEVSTDALKLLRRNGRSIPAWSQPLAGKRTIPQRNTLRQRSAHG